MKIGYDAKRAFCNGTGLGNYSRGVVSGEWRAGNGERMMLYTPRVEERFAHAFDECGGVEVVRPRGVWRPLSGLWRSWGVSLRLRKDGVELFHGLSHELPLRLPEGVRKVVTMHDLIVFRFPEFFKPADRVIHRMKMRHACKVADVVVAISEQTKRDLMEFLKVPEEKIRVVYQSCDPMFWEQPDGGEVREKYGLPERYVICVGTLEERKNQLKVVEAVERLPEDVGVVFVGRPRGDYGRRVAACADGGRVRVLTGADFRDFPALYRGAVASVYLSRFEGFGIPVLESMCCDCPVVTSDVSSMPEAGGAAALYASPDDVETVAAHLRRLLEDGEFRQGQIEKGRTQRMRFAPEKVAQEMRAVYNDLF